MKGSALRIFPWAASLAAMWLFVFACSEGTSTSTTGAGGSTGSTGSTGSGGISGDAAQAIVDTFCTTVAAPLCEAYFACCDDTWRFETNPPADEATTIQHCTKVMSEGTQYPLSVCGWAIRPAIVAQLRAGSTVFDQAQFDTCLNVLKSMAPGGAACVEPPEAVLYTTCVSAFRGQIALGEACPYDKDNFQGIWWDSAIVCKAGRCEDGKCVPYLKPGEACDLSIDQLNRGANYGASASTICNVVNKEVCWGDPDPGGTGGGGGAGGASIMGICRAQGELGDACNPNNFHECKSFQCDVTGKCVPPDPNTSACVGI